MILLFMAPVMSPKRAIDRERARDVHTRSKKHGDNILKPTGTVLGIST